MKNRHTHTHTQPFYGSVEYVRDHPGEPVPEETFTHSHSSWSSRRTGTITFYTQGSLLRMNRHASCPS